MPKLRFRNAILCDYAARGELNKHILVNVYSSDLLFSELPSTIGIGIYLEHIADESGPIELHIEIILNGQAVASLVVNAEGLLPDAVGVILIPSIPLTVTEAGTLEITAIANGYTKSIVISKAVKVSTIPSSA